MDIKIAAAHAVEKGHINVLTLLLEHLTYLDLNEPLLAAINNEQTTCLDLMLKHLQNNYMINYL